MTRLHTLAVLTLGRLAARLVPSVPSHRAAEVTAGAGERDDLVAREGEVGA